MDDTYGIKDWDERCIVCSKATDHEGGLCRLKVGDVMVELCCPLCIETFNRNPKRYLALRRFKQADSANPRSARHD